MDGTDLVRPVARGRHRGQSRTAQLTAELVGLGADRRCAGCDRPDQLLCAACRSALETEPFVAWPSPRPPGLPLPTAAAAYEGPVRATLLAHKERGRLGLADPLGAALARAVAASTSADGLLLVPVPSRRATVRARGHDAMLRTARTAAQRLRATGRQVRVLPVLRATRAVLDQAGLDASQRAANQAGALAVPRCFADVLAAHTVVVVDDVITTGSTLSEAVRAVAHRDAGAVSVAVVAATARRGPAAS